jgi:hypothetical protein
MQFPEAASKRKPDRAVLRNTMNVAAAADAATVREVQVALVRQRDGLLELYGCCRIGDRKYRCGTQGHTFRRDPAYAPGHVLHVWHAINRGDGLQDVKERALRYSAAIIDLLVFWIED